MSAAPAQAPDKPTTMQDFLATVDYDAPAEETPTDAIPPEQTPAAEDAEDRATPTTGRNERGQFVAATASTPDAEADPADTPDTAPATPAPPTRDYDKELADAQRREQTLRAQVENAAKQAEEKGRREALSQATQTARQAVRDELQAAVNRGDLSLDAAQVRFAEKQQEWAREDLAQREQGLSQREAEAQMQALGGTVQEATSALYHRAAPLLAQDHGLTVEEVRSYWDGEEERQRFQRAVLQTQMAQKFPQSGFNASAVEDYLNTTSTAMQQIAKVKQSSTAQLAAKDAEIARLTLLLNRADAADHPTATSSERPSRGGAAPRDEHAIARRKGIAGVLDARDGLVAD